MNPFNRLVVALSTRTDDIDTDDDVDEFVDAIQTPEGVIFYSDIDRIESDTVVDLGRWR